MKWLVGVDEVGRGPLAGPVGVGVVKVPVDFDWALLPGVGDSKAITPKNREMIFRRAEELRAQSLLSFHIALIPATYIDEHGISPAIKLGIKEAIEQLALVPEECVFKLDGSLKAPIEFQQETIIKGDAKEPVIGLASIVAKVVRDEYMEMIHTKYPAYNLAKHKGYGTKEHCASIVAFGLSAEHRMTYCQKLLDRSRV